MSDQWRWLDDLLKDLPEKPSVEEVAGVLDVSTRTVLNWLRDDLLPGYKLPGKWLILREELREYLKQRATSYSPNAAVPDDEEKDDAD